MASSGAVTVAGAEGASSSTFPEKDVVFLRELFLEGKHPEVCVDKVRSNILFYWFIVCVQIWSLRRHSGRGYGGTHGGKVYTHGGKVYTNGGKVYTNGGKVSTHGEKVSSNSKSFLPFLFAYAGVELVRLCPKRCHGQDAQQNHFNYQVPYSRSP